MLDCEEFSTLLRPSEEAFRGEGRNRAGSAGSSSSSGRKISSSTDNIDHGMDFDAAVVTEIDGLPVLTLSSSLSPDAAAGTGTGVVGATGVVLVQDLDSLLLAESCFASLLAEAEAEAESKSAAQQHMTTQNCTGTSSDKNTATSGSRGRGEINPRHVVALDCEWRPQDHPALNKKLRSQTQALHKCSLLQLATASHVFLFDLLTLEPAWMTLPGHCSDPPDPSPQQQEVWARYSQLLSRVLSCPHLLLLGFGLQGDLKRLRESFPSAKHYWCTSNNDHGDISNGGSSGGSDSNGRCAAHEVDMSSVLQGQWAGLNSHARGGGGGGLRSLCKEVLGVAMDKRMQCSDWQRRPLHWLQVSYAALDAVVLVRIWYQLHGIEYTGP